MTSTFWKRDWLIGLAVTLFFLVFGDAAFLQNLEFWAYDRGVTASPRTPSDKIAIIAIDERSIENIGRWPWSRDIHANIIDKLHEGGAKVIAHTAFFSEKQLDPGLEHINRLLDYYMSSGLGSTAEIPTETNTEINSDVTESSAAPNPLSTLKLLANDAKGALGKELQLRIDALETPIATLGDMLLLAENELNADRKLAISFANAGNVVTPMVLNIATVLGNPDSKLPDYLMQHTLQNIEDNTNAAENGFFPLATDAFVAPIPEIGTLASGIGYLTSFQDTDGSIRSEPLVLSYDNNLLPSFALSVAAKSLNLGVQDITAKLGEGVQLGRLNIATDANLQMNTFFYNDTDAQPAFSEDSLFDVFSGNIPVSKYKNKIVLIGATAAGIGAFQKTPVSTAMPPVRTLAHSISSILNEDFFISPEWAPLAEYGVFLLIVLYIMLLLPKLNAKAGAIITSSLFLAIIVGHHLLMTTQGLWLQLITSAALLISGHILLTTKHFLLTERGKQHSDMESAESNRMLGLAFQGQGQLDMAFEKFRKCPKDDAIAEALYNLALDYERKRQFAKAGNVYQYIFSYSPKFRDVEQRIERSKKMEDTVILGGSGGNSTAGGTLILEGGNVEKPMLGRYEVEKELGKGAMGVVYLGKDPKISRVVAIKTMALSQEFEADELDDVKDRFFREAETAGRLNHPNIVTIFDAGEEHDLAFIAMEFLKGKDLADYTKKDNLLPLKTVLNIILHSAQALHYAHSQNVVHRDIKPANIMYDAESNQIKITDFGIARITDSSKTKTGMVLGTPSYMSPEQLAGKKVDGRSDLYSLGVMLYQMVAGELPFKADSMATLMYKITNEPHQAVTEINADIPADVNTIIAKALEKNADARYQDGEAMAKDIQNCMQNLNS